MPTLLLLISLLLHVVAFYFIVVLYMKYSTIKNLSDTQRQILEETENSMTSFLIDMKDENERLINTLLRTSSPNSFQEKRVNTSKETHHQKTSHKEQEHAINNKTDDQQELPTHLTSLSQVEDIVEIKQTTHKEKPPFEVEAINLYKNGYTVEQIAKKLNKGKTEIELLLKFRQI